MLQHLRLRLLRRPRRGTCRRNLRPPSNYLSPTSRYRLRPRCRRLMTSRRRLRLDAPPPDEEEAALDLRPASRSTRLRRPPSTPRAPRRRGARRRRPWILAGPGSGKTSDRAPHRLPGRGAGHRPGASSPSPSRTRPRERCATASKCSWASARRSAARHLPLGLLAHPPHRRRPHRHSATLRDLRH